jgi:hypothetical protein
MFEYVGRLIGIAIRNHDKGYTMLPFSLTSTFWKQLSREKLNDQDFEGIDGRMHKMLMNLEQCPFEDFDVVVDSMYHANVDTGGTENMEEEEKEGERYVYFTTRLSCGRLIELLPGKGIAELNVGTTWVLHGYYMLVLLLVVQFRVSIKKKEKKTIFGPLRELFFYELFVSYV